MIVSPDHHLIDADGKYVWTPTRVLEAWASAKEQFTQALQWPIKPDKVVLFVGTPASGKSFWLDQREDERVLYFDATFDLPFKRKPYIRLAREAGVPVEIVWLDTPLEVCIERNAQRPVGRQVPEDVVRAMHDKIQSSPPSESEGVTVTVARAIEDVYPYSVRVLNQLSHRGVWWVDQLAALSETDLRAFGFIPKVIKEITSLHPFTPGA
jgi:predicted kinase